MLSISAPSTAMGTLTPEINHQIPINYDTKLLIFFLFSRGVQVQVQGRN